MTLPRVDDNHSRQEVSMSEDPNDENVYESPEILELGDVEDLTFGPNGELADGQTLSHDPQPIPC